MPFTDAELISWLPKIRGFSYHLADRSDFEDVCGEAALRLLEKREIVHDEKELFTIIRNLSSSRQRKLSRMIPSDDIELVNYRDDQVEHLYYREICAKLDELLPIFRQVLALAAEGLTYDEMSTTLQIPVGTIRSRLWRAREALRKRLDE